MEWYWIAGIIVIFVVIFYMIFFKKKVSNEKAKKGD